MSSRDFPLQYVFGGQGEGGMSAFFYSTLNPLENVLAPGYFIEPSHLLQPGDLIFVSCQRRASDSPSRMVEPLRRVLLMVAAGDRGPRKVRLVMDFGTPSDGDAVSPGELVAGLMPAANKAAPAQAAAAGAAPCRADDGGDGRVVKQAASTAETASCAPAGPKKPSTREERRHRAWHRP